MTFTIGAKRVIKHEILPTGENPFSYLMVLLLLRQQKIHTRELAVAIIRDDHRGRDSISSCRRKTAVPETLFSISRPLTIPFNFMSTPDSKFPS